MDLDNQIEICSYHYQKWKELAFSSDNLSESRKCLRKAFFWLELQTAFITLFAVERLKGHDPEFKTKLISAKANLSKKLVEYAKEILNELNF